MVSRDAEMRALFAALDRDKNGYVDKNELRETMKEVGLDLSDGDLDLMMRAAVLKDRLFYEDFIRLMTGSVGRLHRKVARLRQEEKLKRKTSLTAINNNEDEDDNPDTQAMRVAFALIDRNGDGLLTEDEIEDTLRSLEVKLSSQNIQTIIDKVNQNANGKLNFGDFRSVMSNYYQRLSSSSSCSATELQAPSTAAAAAATASADPKTDESNSCRQEDLVSAAFKVFDKDKDGYLNAIDLRSTMKQLGLILTEEDVHAMMRSVGVGPLGKISYSDFCRIYKSKNSINAEKNSLKRSKSKLPKRLETELRGVFSIFDLDGDGFITITEVADVLRSMGFHPSIDSIQDVFHQVDLDGNGMIDFGEFLLLATKYERPLSEDREIREMFNALDRDKNGFIDQSDLKASFAGLGIQLTKADVQAMMDEVQRTDDHKICFSDFEQIIKRNFGRRLHLLQSMKSLHAKEFGSSSELIDEKERRLTGRISKDVPSVDQQETSARSSENSSSNARLPSAPLPVPFEIRVTTSSDDVTQASPSIATHVNRLASKRDATPYNFIGRKSPADKSGDEFTIPKYTASISRSTRRGSHWESIFTPSSVAAFCKAQDSYSTTANTWITFKVFDRNADGYISRMELEQTMSDIGVRLSSEELDVMMNEADTNKDGKIDYIEFSKLMKGSFEKYAQQATRLHEMNSTNTPKLATDNRNSFAHAPSSRQRRQTKLPEEEEIRAAFKVFDIDCNGLIDAGELRMTMLHLGQTFSQPQVEAMIKAVDRNRDGKIDYEEFLDMMRSV